MAAPCTAGNIGAPFRDMKSQFATAAMSPVKDGAASGREVRPQHSSGRFDLSSTSLKKNKPDGSNDIRRIVSEP
jgi:hypothetical protein